MSKKSNTETKPLATLGDVIGDKMPKIKTPKPKVITGVKQIRDHRLKETIYFRLPVVVSINNRNLEDAIQSLQETKIDAAWWHAGRSRTHFAPLYQENANVATFTDHDKNAFKHQLGMIASHLMTTLRDIVPQHVEPVELLPSIPAIDKTTTEDGVVTRQIVMDTGHALNYRVLTLSDNGEVMLASFQWLNRHRGDKAKNEGFFVNGYTSKPLSINLKECKGNDDIVDAIVDELFSRDSARFQEIMAGKISGIVYDIAKQAMIARHNADNAKRKAEQIWHIQNADIDWR